MEEWRDIIGYEGKYQVSNLGRVKSLKNTRGNYREKILKPGKDAKGYKQVSLYKNGKGKMYKIHRLVAIAFIPNPNNYPMINHKDEDKTNNCVDNLEWCTNKYNMNYGTLPERFSEARKGEKNCNRRKIICVSTGEVFNYMGEAVIKYNLDPSNLTKCCRGKIKYCGRHPITSEKLVWEYYEE